MLLFTLCNAAVSDRRSVRSMPRSMARREHAALMIPVPPMKRTLISACPVYVTFHIMQRRSFRSEKRRVDAALDGQARARRADDPGPADEENSHFSLSCLCYFSHYATPQFPGCSPG